MLLIVTPQNLKKPLSHLKALGITLSVIATQTCWGSTSPLLSTTTASNTATTAARSSSDSPVPSLLRVRSFTEWMSPALTQNGSSVPNEQGTPLTPTHSFNILWADYTLSQNFKLLLW